jgi:hypothetical protein
LKIKRVDYFYSRWYNAWRYKVCVISAVLHNL